MQKSKRFLSESRNENKEQVNVAFFSFRPFSFFWVSNLINHSLFFYNSNIYYYSNFTNSKQKIYETHKFNINLLLKKLIS